MGFSPHGGLVTDEAVAGLLKYKFHSGEYTALDKLLNPMWIKGASMVPRWVRYIQ